MKRIRSRKRPLKRWSWVLISLAVVFLLAFVLRAATAATRTPEEQEAYDDMVRKAAIDPAMMTKAARADAAVLAREESDGSVVNYHIVGNYHKQTIVVGDSNWLGYADVKDTVDIDLKWNVTESVMVDKPEIRNTKSIVSNPRNAEPACMPPVLKGTYEHYSVLDLTQGLSGVLQMQVRTHYPAVEMAQMCSGSRTQIPEIDKVQQVELSVPSPTLLNMTLPISSDIQVSADKKSLIQKKDGWTWTFTPKLITP